MKDRELSNLGRSKPTDNASARNRKSEDIPAALRDGNKQKPSTASSFGIWKLMSAALGLTLAGGIAFTLATGNKKESSTTPNPIARSSPVATSGTQPTQNSQVTDNVLNHLPYTEAPSAELVSIGGGYRLRKNAAAKFQSMVAAARSSGVNITTISAFRSVEDQKRLFFGVGAERAQQPSKRAEVSAPPKYSEHHTGYAADVGDGSVPATNLNQNFDTTPAYKWLKANAARYSFELSFPKGNIQKVNYEPWHWRFVGDINSLETFYTAHNLKDK
jgi:zinc D-Ala-D-Ala carboxypeptidase